MADLNIAVVIAGKDQLSGPANSAGKSLSNLEKAAQNTGGAFGTMGKAIQAGIGFAAGLGAFNAVSSALQGAASAAIGFEKTMSGVSAVSGASAAQMQQLSGLALQLGKDTAFSAGQAGQGIEELIKGGVSIADVMGGAASAALNLAAAGGIQVGQASEIAANAMSQFGLKGADMAHVSDLIAGAANASSLGVNDFALSLSQVGAVARTAGQDFDSTAQAIAVLGSAGIKGSDAGTSLKTMLLNLQPATKAQAEEFHRLGIVTASGANQFFDATGKAKSMADISQVLQNALKGMTDQQKLASLEILFGSDAMRAAAVFAREGKAGFTEMADSMGKVTAAAVAAERLNNLAGDIEQLKGSAETAGIIFASTLSPAMRTAAQAATRLTNDFTQDGQTLIQTARNIADAHGLGMIPAALTAIELRIGEVFGGKAQQAFHDGRDAVEKLTKAGTELAEGLTPAVKRLAELVGDRGLPALAAEANNAAGAVEHLTAQFRSNDAATQGLAKTVEFLFNVVGELNAWTMLRREFQFAEAAGRTLNLAVREMAQIFGENAAAVAQWAAEVGFHFRNLDQWAIHAQKAGRDVVLGFINGLMSGAGEMAAAAWGMGQRAIASLRAGIDAHSPSRAAEEAGEDVGEGFADGIEESASLAVVAAAGAGASAIEAIAASIGATLPVVRNLVQEAQDAIESDRRDADRTYERQQEAERIKFGNRMRELEIDLGRAVGKERAGVQQRIGEAERAHNDSLERLRQQHADRMVDLEVEEGDRVRAAQEKQALQRGAALRDFGREFVKLIADTESKAAEIGRKTGDAIREALADAGRAVNDARDRASQAMQDAVEGLGASRLLRGRRDTFAAGQDAQDRTRDRLKEDTDLVKRQKDDVAKINADFNAETSELARKRRQEDAENDYQLNRDLERAKTEDDKKALHERFDQAREDLIHRRQLEDAERKYQRDQALQASMDRLRQSQQELAEKRTQEDADRAYRAQQEQARRDFEDGLENEALNRQIGRIITERDQRIASITQSLAEKQSKIEEQERQERATLKASFEEKANDLRTALVEKIGPLTGDAAKALGDFLDGVAAKVADVTGKIMQQTANAVASIAGLGGARGERLFYAGDTLPSGFETLDSDRVINDNGEVRVYRGGGDTPFHKERVDIAAASVVMQSALTQFSSAQTAGLLSSTTGGTHTTSTTGSPIAASLLNQMTEAGVVLYGTNSQLPSFDGGGMVPGAEGAPLLAWVHGGERVLTPDEQRGGGIDYDRLAAAVARALSGMAVQVDGERIGRVARTQQRRYAQSNLTNGVGGIN